MVTVLTPEMQALYDTSNRTQRIRYAHQKHKEGFTISEIELLLYSGTTIINKYLSIPENEILDDIKISRERQHQLAMEQKQKEVDEVRMLYMQGHSISEIGTLMHHIPMTIKKYLDPSYSVVNVGYDVRIPCKLAHFENQVLDRYIVANKINGQFDSPLKTNNTVHKLSLNPIITLETSILLENTISSNSTVVAGVFFVGLPVLAICLTHETFCTSLLKVLKKWKYLLQIKGRIC